MVRRFRGDAMSKADLVLKGGRVLDPASGLDATVDLAWSGSRILNAKTDTTDARTIDVRDLLVVPGLVDLHTHVFPSVMEGGIAGDIAGVESGVCTVVDAGSSGAETIGEFLAGDMPATRSRVVVFLNIARRGLESPPEIRVPADADSDLAIAAIERHRESIEGIKVRVVGPALAALGADVVKRAKDVARRYGLRLMMHVGEPDSAECAAAAVDVINLLEDGDILTHALSGQPGAPVTNAASMAATKAAVERGVILDMGHGIRNFGWDAARQMLDAGMLPDAISTDMGKRPRRSGAFSMTETMTKLFHLGIPLEDVIRMATLGPARAIGHGELGSLTVGTDADATILQLQDGPWTLTDSFGRTEVANRGVVPIGVVRSGRFIAADWGPHPEGWLARPDSEHDFESGGRRTKPNT